MAYNEVTIRPISRWIGPTSQQQIDQLRYFKQPILLYASGHQPVDRDRLVDLQGISRWSPNISVKKR